MDSADTAQTPSDPMADQAQLRRLIETLEDPAKRDELLANLRALLAAQEEELLLVAQRSVIVKQILNLHVRKYGIRFAHQFVAQFLDAP